MRKVIIFFLFIITISLGAQESSQNLAYMKPVTVSQSAQNNPAAYAVDGDRETWWSADSHPPQWIEVDLQTPVDIERINLITSQDPAGETTHTVWGMLSDGQFYLLYEFKDSTGDDQELTVTPSSPWLNIERIRVESAESPSWVAWREIEVFGVAYQTEFIQVADDKWHFETAISQRPFIPFGVNYYDPATYHELPYPAFDVIGAFDSTTVDRQLREIRNLGANIVRIFLSVVSFEPDLYVLNEANFRKLDTLIQIARQQNLRIIFDLVNDWEGNPPWESWEYFADETTLLGYEYYLEAMGTRYADEPVIFSWSLQNEPYVRGPDSGIMGDLWIPYIQFKYGSDVSLAAAWSDYPRTGESWNQIKQPDYVSEYEPLNSPGDQRLYDYQLFREDIAYNWVRRLTNALYRNDRNHMITIGLDQHSTPIKNAVPDRTYTAFNPRKIAPFLDYTSIHAYNWWDDATVNIFIEAIARYNFSNKPVVLEEFNFREAGSTVTPLLNSSSGWLHWGTFAVADWDWSDNLFDNSENATTLGSTFSSVTDWIYDSVPIRAPDVASINIDLKQALTSVDYQNTKFPEYVNSFNGSGGPVGFTVSNYSSPLRLGKPGLDLPNQLLIGEEYKISWTRLDWPIIPQTTVSLLISRDGGDSWETITDNIKENEFSWQATGPESGQCIFRLLDVLDTNIFTESATEFSIGNPTTIEQNGENQSLAFRLFPAYPNPFNPTTMLSYQLDADNYVNLDVYNVKGQLVRTLVHGVQQTGTHHIAWNGLDDFGMSVSSGIYLYRLQAGSRMLTSKVLLMK